MTTDTHPRHLRTLRDVPGTPADPVMDEDDFNILVLTTQIQWLKRDEVVSAAQLCRRTEERGANREVRALAERLSFADGELLYSFTTVCLLASLARKPAIIVLWAHYLVVRSRELGGRVVDCDILKADFPHGFPTDAGARRIWEEQKVQRGDPPSPSDNCLDAAWPWRPGSARA